MTNERLVHHLAVAQEANATVCRRLVQTSVPGECWDVLVLTAANEKQADGYRRELALRHRATDSSGAFFPAIQKTIVVADPPDPPGRRAGSGGGGFGFFLCRAPEQAEQLRQALEQRRSRPGSMAAACNTTTNRSGLQITVSRSRRKDQKMRTTMLLILALALIAVAGCQKEIKEIRSPAAQEFLARQ